MTIYDLKLLKLDSMQICLWTLEVHRFEGETIQALQNRTCNITSNLESQIITDYVAYLNHARIAIRLWEIWRRLRQIYAIHLQITKSCIVKSIGMGLSLLDLTVLQIFLHNVTL